MSAGNERDQSLLTIEIETALRNRILAAAAQRDMSVRDYVVAALQETLDSNGAERSSDQSREWSRLSDRSFARDWDSDADAIYDDLA